MSCLKLHWPQTLSLYAPADGYSSHWQDDAEDQATDPADDAPIILAFPRTARRAGRVPQRDLLNRARILHENRCCPECGRAAVVPVGSENLLAFRDQLPVPGSGRLLGFECESCGHAWDV